MSNRLNAIVTARACALGRLSRHHHALVDVENCSAKTTRKRHSTLSPRTRVTPTADSSTSAMSAKIRYPIGRNLTAPDGIRGIRPPLRQTKGSATVLRRYRGWDGIKHSARCPSCMPMTCTPRTHSSPRHACGLCRSLFLHSAPGNAQAWQRLRKDQCEGCLPAEPSSKGGTTVS